MIKKEDWKFAVEVVGVIAIVVSLLFVALELQQTQDAIAVSGIQSRMLAEVEEASSIYNSEVLPGVLIKAFSGSELTPEEVLRFTSWFRAFHKIHEATFLQVESGYLPIWALEEINQGVGLVLPIDSYGREVWEQGKSIYAPQYQVYIDSLLDEQGAN